MRQTLEEDHMRIGNVHQSLEAERVRVQESNQSLEMERTRAQELNKQINRPQQNVTEEEHNEEIYGFPDEFDFPSDGQCRQGMKATPTYRLQRMYQLMTEILCIQCHLPSTGIPEMHRDSVPLQPGTY